MKLKENWKDIPGFEGLYQASNLGEIRSLNYNRTGEAKLLKLRPTGHGYFQVVLWKSGKRKQFLVHRLVYEVFCGPIPAGMQINHLNEIKTDNRLSNLELVTAKQNSNHGTRNERVGAAHKGKKVSEETKAKMSAAHKGQTPWNLGKSCSEATKAKISATLEGKKRQPFTEETKAKMSLAAKARWQKKINLGN